MCKAGQWAQVAAPAARCEEPPSAGHQTICVATARPPSAGLYAAAVLCLRNPRGGTQRRKAELKPCKDHGHDGDISGQDSLLRLSCAQAMPCFVTGQNLLAAAGLRIDHRIWSDANLVAKNSAGAKNSPVSRVRRLEDPPGIGSCQSHHHNLAVRRSQNR